MCTRVWSQAQKVKIYSAAHSIPHLLNHSSDTHLAVVDKCGPIANQIHLQVGGTPRLKPQLFKAEVGGTPRLKPNFSFSDMWGMPS